MSPARLVVLEMMLVNGFGLYLVERWTSRPDTRGQRTPHLIPNLALTSLLVALNALLDRAAAAGEWWDREPSGVAGWGVLPGWAKVLLVVVVLDGVSYLAHVLMHSLPQAWRFHRVHHSDAHVDVTTAFRQHPLESVWRYAFLFAGATALGAPSAAVVVYLALSALNAQLEHACIRLPFRVDSAVRIVLSTPAMHRVHHSRRQSETDSNYSNIFSFWDRLFGTYRPPRAGEVIAVGLDDCDSPRYELTSGLLALPFEVRGTPSQAC